jgi:membrane protease YdiL (CAAX protease family)
LQNNNFNNRDYNPRPSFIRSLNPFAYVIIVLGMIFFLYQIIGGALALAAGGKEMESNVPVMRIVLAFAQYMFILAPTIFFTRLQTPELKRSLRLFTPSPLLLFLAIAGIILIQPFLQGYMFFQDYVLNHLPYLKESIKHVKDIFDMLEEATIKIVTAYSSLEFLVVVFVICLTPGICEELLFRGFVLKNLEKVARPSAAIFLSGFFFALYHFQPFNLIPLIILGGYLGFIVYYSNSIYVSMVCHFLNNFFASFFLFKYGKEEFETPHVSSSESLDTLIMTIISIVLFAGVIYLFYKLRAEGEDIQS